MTRLTLLLALLLATPAVADDSSPKPPKTLPVFKLLDPKGVAWTAADLKKRGAAIMVTVPSLSQSRAQYGWHDALTTTRPKMKNPPYIVFVEDMASSWFARAARLQMKRDYKPGKPPLLLLDEKGAVRKALGVKVDTTVVLAYDKTGKLVATELKPSKDAANRVWKALGVRK